MMIDLNLVNKTETFLKRKFDSGEYLNDHPNDKAYRIEHTYRVANIGREIALKEGFDETEMVIACLLHDVAYCEDFGEDGWKEHGRHSAKIARPFLIEIGLEEERINDICYGIAIHVDDKADFYGERTAFALSVGDADNIDRFDAYRIHEILNMDGFLEKDFGEKQKYVEIKLQRLRELLKMQLATKTAGEMWKSRIDFYIDFYEKLKQQLERSESIITD
ncbi:MAG: HD domain-containing protein [Clostridia bacterium]|nr:HD domain-containing protein [Clostridia bacterium]